MENLGVKLKKVGLMYCTSLVFLCFNLSQVIGFLTQAGSELPHKSQHAKHDVWGIVDHPPPPIPDRLILDNSLFVSVEGKY